MAPVPLTSRQESRLIGHLDSALLSLARNFNNRHAPNSLLVTLLDYLHALADLQAVVLAIPPAGASAHLRSAYALQLLSLLPDAVVGFNLPPRAQRAAFWARLGRWDEECVAVLHGWEWDSRTGTAKGEEGSGSQLTGTERVRLRSSIADVQTALEGILGPTQFKPLEFNPFVPGSEAEAKLGDHPRPELTERERGEVAIEEQGTPSLVSDAETASEVGMDLDSEVEVPAGQGTLDDVVIRAGGDGESDDDDDFEEVVVPDPSGADDDHFTAHTPANASAGSDAGFSISFQGPPIPLVSDEPGTRDGPVASARGFDPDAEYPDSEPDESDEEAFEVGEEVVESEAAMAVELGKARRVFEQTLAALAEVEGSVMQS